MRKKNPAQFPFLPIISWDIWWDQAAPFCWKRQQNGPSIVQGEWCESPGINPFQPMDYFALLSFSDFCSRDLEISILSLLRATAIPKHRVFATFFCGVETMRNSSEKSPTVLSP